MANVDGDIIDPSKTGRTVVATDGDQSSFGVECTDEILSPDISGDTSLIVADCIIDEDGNDETDEFQVLDECIDDDDDDETNLAVNQQPETSKNVENSKSASSKPEAKLTTATKDSEPAKRKAAGGDSSKTPQKKPRSESTTKRSKSPADNRSRSRDDHGRRSSRSGRTRSRSRSRYRRSRSRSRQGRRRSRSRTRSPQRPARRSSPGKKTSRSSNPPKKAPVKKQNEGSNSKKSEPRKSLDKEKDGSSSKQQKKPDVKPNEVPTAKKEEKVQTNADNGNVTSRDKNDGGISLSQDAISANESTASEQPSASSEVSKDLEKLETFDPNQSVTDDSAVVNDTKSSAGSEFRMGSSAYDGDILEITVPEDATLEEVVGLTPALPTVTPGKATERAMVKTDSANSSVEQGETHQQSKSATDDKSKESKPADMKKTRSSEDSSKRTDGGAKAAKNNQSGKTSKEPPSNSSPRKSNMPVRTSDRRSPVSKASQKPQSKAKTMSNGKGGKEQISKVKEEEKPVPKVENTATVPGTASAIVGSQDTYPDLSTSVEPPRRKELIPEVKAYVDSIRSLEFDVKVYCCFYCVACPLLLPTTPRYEEHLNSSDHKKNVVRWRICQDLLAEELKPHASRQLDVDNFAETVVGADHVIEVCDSNGTPCNFVCVMCSSFHSDVDALLSHLTSFLHIENYMEKQNSDVFSPPDVSVSEFESSTIAKRQADPDHVARVFSAARAHMMRHGRGCMRSYVGDKYHDMNCSIVTELEEMEETVMMTLLEQLFAGDGSYKVKWDRVDVGKSVGNTTYEKQSKETQDKVVGLQTIVEIWFPNRRMPPVYYCAACNYMVTDIVAHCTTNKHWIEYLNKCYRPILDCLLLEADDANSMKESLVTAVKLVLDMEGSNGRIQNVIQLLVDSGDIFCAVHAQIAKQIVDDMGLKFTVPKKTADVKPSTPKGTKPPIKPKSGPIKKEPVKPPIAKKTNPGRPPAPKRLDTGFGRNQRRGIAQDAPRRPLAQARAADRASIVKRAAAMSQAAGRKRPPPRQAIPARLPPRRISPASRRPDRRPEAAGRRRRRSGSRSPQPTRARAEAPRNVPTRFKHTIPAVSPRRSGTNIPIRPVSSVKPKAPLLKAPSRRTPSIESHRRKRPTTPEPRGRPRTPPSPPHHHIIVSGAHHRQQHSRDGFGQAPIVRGRVGVNSDDLRRLTEVLRTHVGLDYGRDLTEEDLDGVRAALPPGTLDDLLELLRRAPSMSFHNFFAERRPVNLAPPAAVVQPEWPIAGAGGIGDEGRMATYLHMGNRGDEGEHSNRRSSFSGPPYDSHRRRRSSKGEYPQHGGHGHRPYDSRKEQSMSSRRAPLQSTPPGMDDRHHAYPMRGAGGAHFGASGGSTRAFDVVQTYENPNSGGAMIGSGGVVYAQPLGSSYSEQTFIAQHPSSSSMIGNVYGRTHGQDSSSVSYGIPIQSSDNSSIFLPVGPQAASTPTDYWQPQSQQPHYRRGGHQDGGRRY